MVGAGITVAGAAAVLSALPPGPKEGTTTTTQTTTSLPTTSASSQGSASGYTYHWQSPAGPQIRFDIWPFRPDLVQEGVDRFNLQLNEAAKLEVVTTNYDSVVTTKLLSGDLDIAYATPSGAAKESGSGLIHDLDDIEADFPKGRILWNVKDIKAEVANAYPSFIETFTTLEGKYVGLPYYQTAFGALLANNKLLSQAGLAGSYPTSYDELYAQIDRIQQTGVADEPFLPLWHKGFPGWGIPQGFMSEMINLYGFDSMFTGPPDFDPTFDTNTSVGDVLINWKRLWDKNQIPKDIITESQDSNVDGLFEAGGFAFTRFYLYSIKPYNDPKASKIAGFAHPVPPGKNGWGYLVHAGFVLREIANNPEYFERAKAMAVWLAYKDRDGMYFEPLNIAAFADIAAHTAYEAVNTGSDIQQAWTTALVDPSKEVPIMNDVLKTAAYNRLLRASWGTDFLVALSENLPKFLVGDADLNTSIATLRSTADRLRASVV